MTVDSEKRPISTLIKSKARVFTGRRPLGGDRDPLLKAAWLILTHLKLITVSVQEGDFLDTFLKPY